MSPEAPTFETTPKRPYLVRALYEWIVDNGLTPHVLVNATMDNVQVPQSYVKDGSIVLNLSPSAVHDWFMDNDAISFSARFNGSPFPLYLPMPAIMAIYARENQDGLSFHDAEYASGADGAGASTEGGTMSVVSSDADTEDAGTKQSPRPAISAVDTADASAGSDDDTHDTPPPKRPTLRVVK